MRLPFFAFTLLALSINSYADNPLSYTGRLTNTNGSPVTGPVDLKLELIYTDNVNNIICSKIITSVPLTNGVFHLKINYSAGECGGKSITNVLADAPANETVALRVTDQVHAKAYSFQAIHALPYAGVATVSKNLTQMGATPGQILSWNGTKWVPVPAGGTGSVTSITTGAGLTGGPITTSGTISILDGGVTASKLNQMGAVNGQVLKWNGASWSPSLDNGLTSETDPTVQGFAKNAPPICDNNQSLKYDSLLNAGAGGFFCNIISLNSDEVPEGLSNKYFTDTRAKNASVANSINSGVVDVAPSQKSVFDALALKQNILNSSSDIEVRTLGVGTASPGARLGVGGTLTASAGNELGMRLFPVVNQSGTAGYTGLLVNVTETSTGSGTKRLMDLQIGGVSKFSIDNNGAMTSTTATSGTTANYTSSSGNQLTLGFNSSNKTLINVDSQGFTTFTANGTATGYNFSGGFVGIGVVSPTEALDVNGSIASSLGIKTPLIGHPTNLTLTPDNDNNGSGALVVTTGLQERMRVLNNGNVGIGTSTPVHKLDVRETTAGAIATFRNSSQNHGAIFLRNDNTAQVNSRNWGIFSDANQFGNLTIAPSTTNSGDPSFTATGLTINRDGRTGIGNTNPLTKLHITQAAQNSTEGVRISEGSNNINLFLSTANNGVLEFASANSNVTNTSASGYLGITTARAITLNSSSNTDSGIRILVNGSERMRVDNLGNVGIGTNAPTGRLDVIGIMKVLDSNQTDGMTFNGSSGGNTIQATRNFNLTSGTNYNATLTASRDLFLTSVTNGYSILFSTQNAEKMRLTSNGSLGIGTTTPAYKLDVVGDINASGSVRSAGLALTSDSRLKEDLTHVKGSLEKISTLNAYHYYWKDKKKFGDKKQLGLVAQEVEKVFPEAIQRGTDGFMAVSYANLIAPVIEAIKDLSVKMFHQNKKLDDYSKRLDSLETAKDNRSPASLVEENKKLIKEMTLMKAYLCKKDPAAPFCL